WQEQREERAMLSFVIGASGYVGRAVVRALGEGGHSVTGFARSEAAANQVRALGAEPVFGDLADPAALMPHLAKADAVVFTALVDLAMERRAIAAVLDALEGSGKPFIMTSGTALLSQPTADGDWTEDNFAEDDPFEGLEKNERVQTELLVRAA